MTGKNLKCVAIEDKGVKCSLFMEGNMDKNIDLEL